MKKFYQNHKLLFFIFLSFFIRILFFLIAYFAVFFIQYKPSFPYSDVYLLNSKLPYFIYSFANFDGVHYLTIANHGYKSADYIQAFFPLYPLLLKIAVFFHINVIAFGLFLNTLIMGFVFFLFYLLIKMDFKNKKIVLFSFLFFIFTPSFFYLYSLYSEALFLLLILGFFILLRQRKFLLASIVAGLASATRIIGVFLVIALIFEYCKITTFDDLKKLNFSKLKKCLSIDLLFFILFSISGFVFYAFYLNKNFNDPFYFAHVQKAFGQGRSLHPVILPQVIYRYIKMFLTVPLSFKLYSLWQEFLFSIFFIVIFVLSIFRKVRLSYLVFCFLGFILPTLSGTFNSMPRYILVLFIYPFVLAQIFLKKEKLVLFIIAILSIFEILNVVLFIQGYWVS